MSRKRAVGLHGFAPYARRMARHAAAWIICGIPLVLLCAVIWVYLLPGRAFRWWMGRGANWPNWVKGGEAMIALGRRIDSFADRIVGTVELQTAQADTLATAPIVKEE